MRFTFLLGINPQEIIEKYNLKKQKKEIIPKNTTKIEELEIIREKPDVVSFLDEAKQLRKCNISMVDFASKNNIHDKRQKGKKYKCFWDKEFIPENIGCLGCPLKYIPNKATKAYFSEISKDTYIISEQITQERYNEIEERKDSRISLEKNNYYETDGIFCSFNCMLSWEKEHRDNPMYKNSEALIYQMYSDIFPDSDISKIMEAPDWRVLESFGGHLTIEKYRSTFNKVSYENLGMISCKSIGYLFESNVKL